MLGFNLVKKVLPKEKLAQIILGGQDGLVNTFGVILGVAAASGDIKVVIAGGLAACFAESISMGAVAYTSQKAEHDHYLSELEKVKKEVSQAPDARRESIFKIYSAKGFKGNDLDKIVDLVVKNKEALVSTIMAEDEKLSPIDDKKAFSDSIIVFVAALVGSLVPLLPFFFFDLKTSIYLSFLFSALTLFWFGFYRGKITVGRPFYNGIELLVIGFTAAILGYTVGIFFAGA